MKVTLKDILKAGGKFSLPEDLPTLYEQKKKKVSIFLLCIDQKGKKWLLPYGGNTAPYIVRSFVFIIPLDSLPLLREKGKKIK